MVMTVFAGAIGVALIHNNAVKPVGESLRIPQRTDVTKEPDDTLLKDLLRIVVISEQGKNPSKEVFLQNMVKSLEGVMIAVLALPDHLRINIQSRHLCRPSRGLYKIDLPALKKV